MTPKSGYTFVTDTNRRVGIWDGSETLLIGRLDEDGEFHQVTTHRGLWYSGPTLTIINRPYRERPTVYEFRSGWLYLGEMNSKGQFSPYLYLLNTPLPFAAYKYTPDVPRIWNLPGYFKPPPGTRKHPSKG